MRRLPMYLLGLLAVSLPCVCASPNDYSKPENWLCRPGRTDACSGVLTATIIAADGTHSQRTYQPNPSAPIDCFYVYPTVSTEKTANSDMAIAPEQERAAKLEFARFGEACRLYAPVYRQVTLPALRGEIPNDDFRQSTALAYADVQAAWRSYLQGDNHGRGVVLIGHSQGARLLKALVAQEIDGKPDQKKLVSAILLGSDIEVPRGRSVGDELHNVPLCESQKQSSCIVAYSTFLASNPPGEDATFGKNLHAGSVDACVNPAQLMGTAKLDADFPAIGGIASLFGTTFVENPGLLSAKCTETSGFSFLAISVGDGAGSVVVNAQLTRLGERLPGWGLHALDVNLALGSLVALVHAQADAWAAASSTHAGH